MKVIARSIRKGNIIAQDGRLYVVLSAENIHPGKGTPVSQIEMRRIGDGVKVSERYKTTDQVERAFVEDRDFNYLYEDGDGFHFMNNENYDQLLVPKDVVGSQAPYLQENMTVKLSIFEGNAVAIEVKRRGEIDGVEQLVRYLERMERDPLLRGVRGMFVAQVVKPQARVLAESRGVAWVEVDYDVLRGAREADLTLF